MSSSAIVRRRRPAAASGVTVYSVLPLTRRMSLTFMAASGRSMAEHNIAHNAATDILSHPERPSMPGPSDPGFDTLALHAGAAPDPATGARALPIHLTTSFVFETQRPRRRRCSTWSARATSTAASATRPTRCSRSAWPRSKAASARSPPPAARPRCTWRSPRWPAPARTSSRARALYGGSHNLLHYTLRALRHRDHLRQAGRHRRLARRDPARTRSCCSARRSATRASTCSTSRPSARSRTTPACRCWSTRPSPRPG